MKTYINKHNPDWIATETAYSWYYAHYKGKREGDNRIPKVLIEESSDWQLQEEIQVPPGIKEMNIGGTVIAFMTNILGSAADHKYNDWISSCFKKNGTVHQIEVEGVLWTVGEEVKGTSISVKKICALNYDADYKCWFADLGAVGWWNVGDLQKFAPPRTPIVTLKDENGKDMELFEGERYWFVNDSWIINSNGVNAIKSMDINPNTRYRAATEAACIKWVSENKPMLPAIFLHKVEQMLDIHGGGSVYWRSGIQKIIDEYKSFIKTVSQK